MRGLVVYESMFGSTREVAEAVAAGLGSGMDVRVVRAVDAADDDLVGVDLLVVGAPTHVHGMPRPSTRRGAPDYVDKPGNDLELEPGADPEAGVREWLTGLHDLNLTGAAFDTRVDAPAAVTGRASKGIAKLLSGHGISVDAPNESFLVDKHSALLPGELDRARSWGEGLAPMVSDDTTSPR
jgi:hypothetical protein